MNIEEYRDYCMSKPGTTEEFPFDDKTLVFKVSGKMYALTDVEDFKSINLKCEPQLAIELREQFAAVEPGYHMNKQHWNTVTVNGDAPDDMIYRWIDDSYELVKATLTKKAREELAH